MMEELKLISPGEVRVRIAPSPTGPMHIGLARTALFNYLFARKYQGAFILRIEDTDKERSKKEYEEEIIAGLRWLGLEYEEGPDKGGPYAPYRQSERKEIYRKYIQQLLDEGKIYHCFCSLEELEAHRQYLLSIGKAPCYSGKCRQLSQAEVKKNLQKGKPYILRFKTPLKKVKFEDLLRGEIIYDSENFGDFAVAKSLEEPLYNLAAVIDDQEMKITHIIRGEDHISNTPKQILLAEALNFQTTPQYLHLPLILGPDRAKLSKRHNVKSVLEYKKEGYLSEAIINFLAFLGWNPGTEKEIFSINSLIKEFSLKGLQKSGAAFNAQKLDWLNGFYIRQKSIEKLTELCLPYLLEKGFLEKKENNFFCPDREIKMTLPQVQAIVELYRERMKKLSEITELTNFFFCKKLDYPAELLLWKSATIKETRAILDKIRKVLDKLNQKEWHKEKISNILMQLSDKAAEGDRGKVLWPFRAALSGKKASAGPFEIAAILGKEETIERVKEAQKKIHQ